MTAALANPTSNFTFSCPNDDFFEELIATEFSRLRAAGQHYLDYTGGGLYATSQIRDHYDRLAAGVFGNPHSINPTSKAATEAAEITRRKVLEFFNAGDEYYCVFTANASGALKIVGECFPWASGSQYLLLTDNHNSVNGIREYCNSAGGNCTYAPVCADQLTIDEEALSHKLGESGHKPRLFAYPAQSNVSGVKHDLRWVEKARSAGWYTLLDAAAYVPTNKLDLQVTQPDFVSLSFYKMFGYPTGVGALLIRKSAFGVLQKKWFAGGNVRIAGVGLPDHLLHDNHERFENGTINYLGLPAITTGLAFLESVGMDRLQARVRVLASYLVRRLRSLRHANGRPLVKLYGPKDRTNCGGTVILTVLDSAGRRHCFRKVEARAAANNISIRSGCFCNPGLDEVNSGISTEELTKYFTVAGDTDFNVLMEDISSVRGATRASVGVATRLEDIEVFVGTIASFAE